MVERSIAWLVGHGHRRARYRIIAAAPMANGQWAERLIYTQITVREAVEPPPAVEPSPCDPSGGPPITDLEAAIEQAFRDAGISGQLREYDMTGAAPRVKARDFGSGTAPRFFALDLWSSHDAALAWIQSLMAVGIDESGRVAV